jgi:hypothetical protein
MVYFWTPKGKPKGLVKQERFNVEAIHIMLA